MSFGMLRREEPKPPKTPQPPSDVSPVYYHLYDDIANDQTLTPAAKTIVFCAAYTLYSLEKKDSVLGFVLAGKQRASREISQSFAKYLTTPGTRSSIVRGAKELATNYQAELKSF